MCIELQTSGEADTRYGRVIGVLIQVRRMFVLMIAEKQSSRFGVRKFLPWKWGPEVAECDFIRPIDRAHSEKPAVRFATTSRPLRPT